MYLVRLKSFDLFEVAKFSDYSEPESVYNVRNGKCSCPAAWGKRSCKHTNIVAEFKKASDGVYWFDIVNNAVVKNKIAILELN